MGNSSYSSTTYTAKTGDRKLRATALGVTVASATLAERDAKLAETIEASLACADTQDTVIADLRAKLAEAEATRDKYEKDAIYHWVKVMELQEERDAAYVRCSDIANEIANRLTRKGEQGDSVAAEVRDAIAAEIAKAGKP